MKGEGAKSLENSILFSDVAASDYDAIYVPGGHGACYDMPQNEALAKMLADAYQGGKTIGSVCHGPVCFANVKLDGGKPFVEGKKVDSTVVLSAASRNTFRALLFPHVVHNCCVVVPLTEVAVSSSGHRILKQRGGCCWQN